MRSAGRALSDLGESMATAAKVKNRSFKIRDEWHFRVTIRGLDYHTGVEWAGGLKRYPEAEDQLAPVQVTAELIDNGDEPPDTVIDWIVDEADTADIDLGPAVWELACDDGQAPQVVIGGWLNVLPRVAP